MLQKGRHIQKYRCRITCPHFQGLPPTTSTKKWCGWSGSTIFVQDKCCAFDLLRLSFDLVFYSMQDHAGKYTLHMYIYIHDWETYYKGKIEHDFANRGPENSWPKWMLFFSTQKSRWCGGCHLNFATRPWYFPQLKFWYLWSNTLNIVPKQCLIFGGMASFKCIFG